jgi:hypothetical protein
MIAKFWALAKTVTIFCRPKRREINFLILAAATSSSKMCVKKKDSLPSRKRKVLNLDTVVGGCRRAEGRGEGDPDHVPCLTAPPLSEKKSPFWIFNRHQRHTSVPLGGGKEKLVGEKLKNFSKPAAMLQRKSRLHM